jgi:hypothetical protein
MEPTAMVGVVAHGRGLGAGSRASGGAAADRSHAMRDAMRSRLTAGPSLITFHRNEPNDGV